MRTVGLSLGMAGVLAGAAAFAQNTRQTPTPTTDLLPQLQMPAWAVEKPLPPITTLVDAEALLPQHLGLNVANGAPRDTRTPAQLNAMLSAYVGTWRGEAASCYFSNPKTLRYPVELVYKIEQDKGRSVLVCNGTYLLPDNPQVMQERAWVENGRIVAELAQGSHKQTFVAHSRGSSLVWYSTDTAGALVDFSQVETLRLTVDGGVLHYEGYDVEYGPRGEPIMISQSADLKLVKP